MQRERAIVFDLDDTLYPEREFVRGGFKAAAVWAESRVGVPWQVAFVEFCRLSAENAGHVFDRWTLGRRLDPHLVPGLVDAYRGHAPDIRPFAQVPALLAQLAAENALGLLSDGLLEVQKRKLAALGLADRFQAVVFSDQWGRPFWKPHRRPFETILEHLGVTARRAIYVADNPAKDFVGARRVGLASVRVRFGGVYHDCAPPDADHAADRDFDEFADLERFLTDGHW